jgi:hypothetical protein
MAPFSPFIDLLAETEDPRRAEGKLYRLPQVVLFAILAIVAGANSYRTIHSLIDVHLGKLRDAFGRESGGKHRPTRRSAAFCDSSTPPPAAMPPP